ncbi:MAG: hypothetical protein ABFD50_07910 [Smithella sp.]
MREEEVIIAISGKLHSGKSTLAQSLLDWHNGETDFEITSIAHYLKVIYCKYESISMDELKANKEKHRDGLVELGQCLRAFRPDFLIRLMLNQSTVSGLRIVDDVRLTNELFALQHHGKVFSVYIDVDNDTLLSRFTGDEKDLKRKLKDKTETGFTGDEYWWDYRFENNSTDLKEMDKQAKNILKLMKMKGLV